MEKGIEDALAATGLSDVAAETNTEQADAPKPAEAPLGQFKDEAALLEGYKNVQGFATRVSQENKELKDRIAAIEAEQAEARNVPAARPDTTPNVDYETLVDNPGKTIVDIVRSEQVNSVLVDLEVESLEDPTLPPYNERFQWAQSISNQPQFAHLVKSPSGIRKLFKMGDKERERQYKTSAHKSLEMILGAPVDDEVIERFKKTLGVDKRKETKPSTSNAYMPDSSTSTYRPGSETAQRTNHDTAIADSASKGDMAGTIENIFQKALAK